MCLNQSVFNEIEASMAQRKLKPLTESPRYTAFIRERDKALETLLLKSQMKITDILGGALQRVMEVVSYWYGQSKGNIFALRQVDSQIEQPFINIEHELVRVCEDLQRKSYLLSHAGEVEAMSRAIGKPKNLMLARGHGPKPENPNGGDWAPRIHIYLKRIQNNISDAIKISAVSDEDLHEALDRIRRSFPSLKRIKRPPRVLKSLTEKSYNLGTQQNKSVLSVGFIDDTDWQDMVKDYKSDYIFTNRGPDGVLDEEEAIPQYEWELEQDMTQSFVHSVRDGQVDAAEANGIDDMMWISIIDASTDECCVWRDGLTSSQISLALANEHADDECDTDVPPAHFNCRCSIAPVTDDMPDTPPPDFGSFEDWLNETSS